MPKRNIDEVNNQSPVSNQNESVRAKRNRYNNLLKAETSEQATLDLQEKAEDLERAKRTAAAEQALAEQAKKRAREEEATEEAKKRKLDEAPIDNQMFAGFAEEALNQINAITNQPILATAPNLAGCGGQGPANPLFILSNRVHLNKYRPQRNLPNINNNPNNGDMDNLNNQPANQPVNNPGQLPQPQVAPAAAATGNTLLNLLLGTAVKKAATTLLTTGFGTAVNYMFGDSNEGTNNSKPKKRTKPLIEGGTQQGSTTPPVIEEETPAPTCSREARAMGDCH
jgi:hypothetical protein